MRRFHARLVLILIMLTICSWFTALHAASANATATPAEQPTPLFLPFISSAPASLPATRSVRLVKDILPGSESSNPFSLLVRGAGVQFNATSAGSLTEPLKSNGTAEGTTLFRQLRADTSFNTVIVWGEIGSSLLFLADDGVHGAELWRTDRAFNNATLLVDINPGNATSQPSDLGKTADALLFFANNGTNGFNLWRTDGTPEGTRRVQDTTWSASVAPLYLGMVDKAIIFALRKSGGTNELWRTDGTANGTMLFKSVGLTGDTLGKTQAVTVGKLIFFKVDNTASDGTPDSRIQLWRTDGTTAGTVRVAEAPPSSAGNRTSDFTFVPSDGTYLYYFGYEPQAGLGLWRTDGTVTGTIFLVDISYGEDNSYNVSGATFKSNLNIFLVQGLGGSYQLWRTDGTATGTFRLRDEPLMLNRSVLQTDNLLFFVTLAGADGRDSTLWRSDGTIKGTFQLLTVPHESTDVFIDGLTPVGGSLIFASGVSGVGQRTLWHSDGTVAGTSAMSGVDPGEALLEDTKIINNNVFYFPATDAAHGLELWKADGTRNEVRLVRDICPGTCSANPRHITAVNNALVFSAEDGIHGSEVWRSDGTEAGTQIVDDIEPGSNGSGPNWFAVADTEVFFSAAWHGVGNELWAMPISAVTGVATRTRVEAQDSYSATPLHSSGTYQMAR